MKAFITVAALSAIAAALPYHNKREAWGRIETDYVTAIEYVTATAAATYVYVDQFGQRIPDPTQTTFPAIVQPEPAVITTFEAPAPAPTPAATSEAAIVPVPVPEVPVSVPVVAAATSAAAAIPLPSFISPPVSSSGVGITYSAYKLGDCGTNACAGNCKSASEVKDDLSALQSYPIIRIYGTDCNQIANVLAGIDQSKQKLFLGVYWVDAAKVDGEISDLKSQVGNNWGLIDTIAVGNEAIPNGYSVSTILDAVSRVRSGLAGQFNGPVVTVDTIDSYVNNPGLCKADTNGNVYANCHAFFDTATTPLTAANFIQGEIARVKTACGANNVIITESGWPSGSLSAPAGDARANPINQKLAVENLSSAFQSNFYLFSAYNEMWKPNTAGTLGVENYWGVHGVSLHP